MGHSQPAPAVPTLDEALAAKTDVWGDAAMRQPDGASYAFFAHLLPPLRYVNADFRHYPIVLSAPVATKKARLISNGSAINARANTRSWREMGVPVTFRVGDDELRFGEYPHRLDGPRYAEGYLPIVALSYQHGMGTYLQETFASVESPWSEHAVSLSRFTFRDGEKGRMVVRLDTERSLEAGQGSIRDAQGRILVWYDSNWHWNAERGLLEAEFEPGQTATVAVATDPMEAPHPSPLSDTVGYDRQRRHCAETWKNLLGRGMNVEVPEAYVNNAWRSLVIANFALINGDRMHYSAGNQYDKLYEGEGSDAARALLLWGYDEDMRRLIVPLLDFTRNGLEYHQAGHNLASLCHYYWQTRDAEFVRAMRPRWQKEVRLLVDGRSSDNGLYPREQYCGDIATPVFSLNSNANGWRALRDISRVLAELGEEGEARRIAEVAEDFRKDILAAVEKSEHKDTERPFIPLALFGEEQPYERITETKPGSYWNLMANYVLGSGVFGIGAEREKWLMEYLQQRGGLCMGLIRTRCLPAFWAGSQNLNPLYGLRYVQAVLRNDEPERALVSFYGMLAQGLTPDTFTCGEGQSLTPLDHFGRQFYCPPNSAGNGFFLQMLRSLLVQDGDMDDDGVPETLRLLFATPRRWLSDGQAIKVERAPTPFGEVSLHVRSRLKRGEVEARIEAPARAPQRTLLRIRVPEGWQVTSAQVGTETLKADAQGTVDISWLRGQFILHFQAKKSDTSPTDGFPRIQGGQDASRTTF